MSAQPRRFGRRSASSIAIELIGGVIVATGGSILLHGLGGGVTDWICFIVGAMLILHAIVSLVVKAGWFGVSMMMTALAVCLTCVLAASAFGAQPEQQGCNGNGCYAVYPAANGCRTIIASNTGTYPQFVVSVNPLHISFAGVDYVWPVSVSYCWEYVTAAANNQVVQQQKFLYGVRIYKDYGWEHVDGSVVKDYSFTGAKAVYSPDKSCVTIRVHASVRVQIPPLPHVVLPVSFVTKPWIQFNNLCIGGGYDPPTFDHEPA